MVPLSPEQALDQLRQILATGQTAGAIRSDVAQDLHNQVESIAVTLTVDPTSTNLVQKIDSLRAHVLLRSTEQWGGPSDLQADPTRPPITTACRDAMLAAIDKLKTAVTTP